MSIHRALFCLILIGYFRGRTLESIGADIIVLNQKSAQLLMS